MSLFIVLDRIAARAKPFAVVARDPATNRERWFLHSNPEDAEQFKQAAQIEYAEARQGRDLPELEWRVEVGPFKRDAAGFRSFQHRHANREGENGQTD